MFKIDFELSPKTYSIRSYRKRDSFKDLRKFLYYFFILALIAFVTVSVVYLWNSIY